MDVPDIGDIVIGLLPKTYGHYLIKTIQQNNDGTMTIKFVDMHDDTVFIWRGDLGSYNKSFKHELAYTN